MSMSFLPCLSNANQYLYIYICIYTYIIRRSPRSSADASVQVLSVTKCRMHGTTQDEVRCRQQQRMAIVKLFSCLLMQGQRYLAGGWLFSGKSVEGFQVSGWTVSKKKGGVETVLVLLAFFGESSCFTLPRTKHMLKLIHNKEPKLYNMFSKVKQVTSN